MAQMATFKWTNAATAAARTQPIGFAPAHIKIMAVSGTVANAEWNDQMVAGSVQTQANAGTLAYSATNGITFVANPPGQFGQSLSGAGAAAFTNANPGVITVNDGSFFKAGDIINVTGVANTNVGPTLNGQYTIASVTGNALTTTTNTTAYGVRVSGGTVSLYSRPNTDGNYDPAVNPNLASYGITIGTAAVGGNAQQMVMTVWGKNNVT
jgi:hypothetical protein